jgi:hypothetical protein
MTSTNPGYTNYTADQAVSRAKSYGTWDTNMCMNFVWYQLSYAHVYGIADANAGWSMAKRKHTGSDKGSPPAGAPVYWGTSHPYGHVAISVGDGKCRSTDWPSKGKVGTVSISEMTNAWGMTLKGWTEDLCGDTIQGLLEGDDDMPLSNEDINKVADAVFKKLNPDTGPTHDRVFGFLHQRWYVTNADGSIKSVAEGTKNAKAAHGLDTLDGNSIQLNIDRAESAIIKKIDELK